MPKSGPSGIATGPTAVQYTSVSTPTAQTTHSSSSPTPSSNVVQPTAPSLEINRSSTPSSTPIEPSPEISPSNTSFASQQEADASHPIAPPPSAPATIPTRSTVPSQHYPPQPLPSVTQDDPPSSVSPAVPSMHPPSHPPRPTPNAWDENRHHNHGKGKSISYFASEHTPTGAPSLSISPMSSGEMVYTNSKHHFHPFTKWPKPPQQIVSESGDLITIVSKTTDSGTVFQTTLESIGPGSYSPIPVPAPTLTGNVSPDSSSTATRHLLPLILGVVLGMLALVAFATVFFKFRRRRHGRSKYMPTVLSYDSDTSREQKDNIIIEATPQLKSLTRIAPYRLSSTYTPEYESARIQNTGESSDSGDEPLSDPFADSSAVLSSPTSKPPASLHSVDSSSIKSEFTMSANADTREGGETGRLIDESTSSLELQFASPPVIAARDASTRSQYWSPTWHYDGESAGPSSGRTKPTPSRPFLLGAESARLRLHALLKEARRV